MASDPQLNQVLVAILEILKQQSLYLDRQHRWLIALAESMQHEPDLGNALKRHTFYDLGPEPRIQNIDVTIQNIDALMRRLRKN